MNSQLDLTTASREELLAIIAQQQEVIAELQATVEAMQGIIVQLQGRIVYLEGRLGGKGSAGPPCNKPANAKPPQKKPRKGRPQGFARQRMAPTQRIEHAVAQCPDCGTKLRGGWVQRTREVIEVPIAPVAVIEHIFIARQCPLCNRRQVPRVDLGGIVVGQQRLGVNLVSLIVSLREEGRLPVRIIQWYLSTFHQLRLSVGEIVRLVQQTARHAEPVVEAIKQTVRESPAVCADETGWRENGHLRRLRLDLQHPHRALLSAPRT